MSWLDIADKQAEASALQRQEHWNLHESAVEQLLEDIRKRWLEKKLHGKSKYSKGKVGRTLHLEEKLPYPQSKRTILLNIHVSEDIRFKISLNSDAGRRSSYTYLFEFYTHDLAGVKSGIAKWWAEGKFN